MRRVMLVIVATAMLTIACSTPPAPPPPVTPTLQPTPTGLALPPRPRELPLDGVDPCALLTPTQRTTLGLRTDSKPFTATAPGFAGPACALLGDEPRAISVGLILSTGSSISVLTGPGTRDEISPITVAGFPAILARPTLPDFCSVDIDIANGQFIDIQFADGGRPPPIPQDQLCLDAVQVAEAVMLTMQTT